MVGQVIRRVVKHDLLIAVTDYLRCLSWYDEILFTLALSLDFGCEFYDASCCFLDFS